MINTQEIKKLITNLNEAEKAWLFGYLEGIFSTNSQNFLQNALPQNNLGGNNTPKFNKVGILYVTETGNSKKIAGDLSSHLKEVFGSKLTVKVYNSQVFKPNQLQKEECLIVIASTHGDGEVPESGKALYDFLSTTKEKLTISYAVLALGDSSYPFYCKAGVDIDASLGNIGGTRLLETKTIDVDLVGVDDWFCSVSGVIGGGSSTVGLAKNVQALPKAQFQAEVLANVCLSDVGSNKEVHHIAFSVEDGVVYECGDALSITPVENDGKKASPRLYSIASSPTYHEGEVHVLVSVVKNGLCSNYLKSLPEGIKIECKIAKNNLFKLPEDDKNIIMVGPGTGLAPFRGFLFERQARGASGKNWLFFGEQRSTTDFYYQLEMQEFVADGTLTHLDLAFSRDAEQKTYVQHRMKERALELFTWLESGAVFYICGAKDPMAKDVELALLEIIAEHSGKGQEFALEYLNSMIEADRYRKDVY